MPQREWILKMKSYTKPQLDKILADHQLWISSNYTKGKQAYLYGANLSLANLSGANLSGTILHNDYCYKISFTELKKQLGLNIVKG